MTLATIVALMAALALAETLAPLRFGGTSRRAHLAANLGLTGATLLLYFALGAGAVFVSEGLSARGLGLLSHRALPAAALIAAGVVTLDLASYAAHRLLHRVPALWRVHRVHHSDRFVDVSTAFRQHPLEGVLRFTFMMVPAWLLGLPAEAIVVYRLLSAANAVLEHANVGIWRPLDGALSLVVVTPDMHKVHHSRLQPETDSNYGNIFSVFDRAFSTFSPTARARVVEYGLDGHDRELQIAKLLRLPFE